VALSVVTEMEIRFGLARNPGLRIAPLVEEFLDAMTVLPVDSDVARTYGRIRAELDGEGRPIAPLDTMIAAHAVAVGATLVTNDVRGIRASARTARGGLVEVAEATGCTRGS
jgi:tRNA(fMet)-specific endonuclease VapC